MSGQNLGKFLAEAGVKGAKPSPSPLTLKEVQALSRKQHPKEVHEQEAMNRLPVEFTELGEVSSGQEFLAKLEDVMGERERDMASSKKVFDFDVHVVYGIVQLAHYHRDRLQGAKRKSFARVIPQLLRAKKAVEKKKSENVVPVFRHALWPPDPPSCKRGVLQDPRETGWDNPW